MEAPDGGIDVAAACGEAMRLLEAGGMSHAEVSARTGLSAGAVGIVADAVSWRGAAAERGWASLPSDAQFSLIKSECYPVPTKDAWIMARLLGEGAVGPDTAATVPEDRAVRELVGSGCACRTAAGRFYLTGDGPMLAKEVLASYPEIDWASFARPGGGRRRARELVGAAVGMLPPAPALAQREVRAP